MKFYRNISALFLFFTLTVILISSVAIAQMSVNVRTGSHDDYSRLVFDWPEATSYQKSQSGGTLTLSFDKAASVDLAQVNQSNLKNIGSVRAISAAGENLRVAIDVKSASKIRDFKIGNRVVVDVYNASGEVTRSPVSSAEEKITAQPETVTAPQPEHNELEALRNDPTIEVQNLSGLDPHVVTLTSTRSVGMAAFEREGFFWMVFDNPDLKTKPILAGPKKDKLPKIEKVEIENGVAYRMATIPGYNFYGEGGGLLWRIVMTPNPRRTNPVSPVVNKQSPEDIKGGTLVWPFKSPEKILKVQDPLIGDEITVVTVQGSEDFAGAKRSYVELETLYAPVGLAFAAKVDDVDVSKTNDGVEVTTPAGLALSSKKDSALAVLKDDIQKEQEFFDEAEKTERLNLIYDFDRWEMGGINALDKNRQVLMRGIGAKEGSAKVEDIITLAKLNLANNRGPEALGLLNVAAQELPGIDEDPEYIALKGAAEILSGQFSEGLEDLSDPSLSEYTERNYWRSRALAGLEDWRQADKLMPRTYDVLNTYPMPIRKPLVLSLAEIALRAGKADQAEELLSSLESEFPTMDLPEQSAWKYLNGELERQKGNPKQAIENWQTLITGKDDYYRAKAGLSLTKLQLERQKITPAKAIDRLEGLRYAWRGDELETLINLRLGEVYIENGDYLKGLTVLRNAVSLSPDAPITEEVTDYMTTTFANIFTDGTLDKLSPLDAISIYDEFKELTPLGKEGDIFVQNLAERLVDIDLLGRASDLLQFQLDNRLEGAEAVDVGIRLAAIQLIDGNPEDALETIDKTEKILRTSAVSDKAAKQRELNILKARAQSKVGRATEALNLLNTLSSGEDVSRLRADIAWNAGQWDQAEKAFAALITRENISLTRPADDYETNLIINRAIALNLAGNRSALAEMRARYKDVVAQTNKSKIFELVTRPRQLGVLESKDSVTSLISEVDLFGEFLDNYKSGQGQ
jgi:predicted negative regulator of RcsB-dependent stress response